MNYQHLDDGTLIDFLKAGNACAFEEMYRRYWYKLFGVAYHETGTREEAEELVQDVFESLWERRLDVTIVCLSAYLVVAIKRSATKQLRNKLTHQKFREYLIFSEIRQSLDTEYTVLFEDLSGAVEAAMKKLPEKSAEVFRLSRFENQPIRAIAEQMHLSEKAVEYHITKSLRYLRDQLKFYQSDN